MRPYSQDLRLRVVQAYAHHEGSMRQLAARFRLWRTPVPPLASDGSICRRIGPTCLRS
jgi:hypothetical protein